MKVLPDTVVLIGFFREPGRRAKFEARWSGPLWHVSSVVALELFAGCKTRHQQAALGKFLAPFEKAGRLITPDHACFREAGRVLAKLGVDGIGAAHRRQLVNDVLIAVSGRPDRSGSGVAGCVTLRAGLCQAPVLAKIRFNAAQRAERLQSLQPRP